MNMDMDIFSETHVQIASINLPGLVGNVGGKSEGEGNEASRIEVMEPMEREESGNDRCERPDAAMNARV